ncbi:MAG: aminotransferase class V-fold PLP-dependent enzyme [Euzebyales bacterium]|nr:aminotransferase class V-fold PLP-dependent enzyme [Euzebyales bacterium]
MGRAGAVGLGCQRAAFDLPGDVTYLNCATLSPSLRAVTAAGHAAVDAKARPWGIGPPDFFAGPEEARALFAQVLGADADGVAIVPAVSYSMATAAANLSLGAGRRVLVLAEEFPSPYYAWKVAADRAGAEIATVPRPADGDWTAAVLGHIDERVAVVSVPNCHWTDGGLVDLVRVGAAARAVGAALVVDASQSLGAAPLDVEAVRPDVVVAVGYKWLLGPYSLGYAWFAPRWRDGVPREENWMARAGSEDFTGLVDYTDAYQSGARRYDMGEVANFLHLPMSIAALRQIRDWGVPRIAATIRELVDAIATDAEALGLAPTPAAHRLGHMVGLRFPAGAPPDLAKRLAEAQVHVSVRGDAVRVAPHVYNDARDVARLRDALAVSLQFTS